MKKLFVSAIAGSVCALAALNSPAQDTNDLIFSNTRFYTEVSAGGLFQQGIKFVQKNGGASLSQTATFNPGGRASLGLGYNLNDVWSLKFETGLMYNTMDKLDGLRLSSVGLGVDQYTVPIMTELVYRFPLKGRFAGYVGLGAGGIANTVDLNGAAGDTVENDFEFAYQAEAALTYSLNDHATIGLQYQFLGTTTQSYPYFGERIEFQNVYTHSVMLVFNWQF